MKIKRYIVKDMAEAMMKIKNELGTDAVILHSRKVKEPGILGFFGKSQLEVVAAIDEEKERQAAMAKAMEIKRILVDTEGVNKNKDAHKHSVSADDNDDDSSHIASEKNEINRMSQDIQYLKDMIQTLINDRKENPSNSLEVPQSPAPESNLEKKHPSFKLKTKQGDTSVKQDGTGEKFETLMKLLLENDIHESHIQVFEKALKEMDISTPASIRGSLEKVIFDLLGKVYTIEKDYAPPKVFFFVGPTGVGKTTTLAKLAARLSLIENKRIGLITADTFRIAAVDQLRTYCEILGVPLSVVYEADEIKSAIKKYKQCDYILVDTAGRSHKSDDMPKDIKGLLQAAGQSEIFLVLSATTGYKDLKGIIQSYDFIKDYKVIITKLDEASSIGNVLNILMLTEKPLTYFTIGQSVPDDIEIANTDRILNAIMGEL